MLCVFFLPFLLADLPEPVVVQQSLQRYLRGCCLALQFDVLVSSVFSLAWLLAQLDDVGLARVSAWFLLRTPAAESTSNPLFCLQLQMQALPSLQDLVQHSLVGLLARAACWKEQL